MVVSSIGYLNGWFSGDWPTQVAGVLSRPLSQISPTMLYISRAWKITDVLKQSQSVKDCKIKGSRGTMGCPKRICNKHRLLDSWFYLNASPASRILRYLKKPLWHLYLRTVLGTDHGLALRFKLNIIGNIPVYFRICLNSKLLVKVLGGKVSTATRDYGKNCSVTQGRFKLSTLWPIPRLR